MDMREKLLSIADVAKILKVSKPRISQLITAKRIKYEKFGRSYIITDYSEALERVPGNPNLGTKSRGR